MGLASSMAPIWARPSGVDSMAVICRAERVQQEAMGVQ